MGRLVRWLVLLFCLVGVLSAAHAEGQGKSFLWKITGRNGSAYIFGSIHMAREDMYPLPQKVEKAFAGAKVLALEADPTKADQGRMQEMVRTLGMYAGSDSLEHHVSSSTFSSVRREVELAGLPIDQFLKLKPWLLAATLDVLELQKLGFDPSIGIDKHFAANATGKKIVELESFDYQFHLFDSLSEKEQELFLVHSVNEIENLQNEVELLISAWQTGDTRGMEQHMAKDLLEHPELAPIYDRIYTRRNKEMTAKIEQYIKLGIPHFIVVGSLHLVGREGIIELLKGKGYRVEQL